MITRPLELATRLRAEPRSFDWLFYVNGGLIVLFFFLFGSRFVLAPGLGVNFQLPTLAAANASLAPTTHRITVISATLILAGEGSINSMKDLETWLTREAKKTRQPSLLVFVGASAPSSVFTDISRAAERAGFAHVQIATQEPAGGTGGGR
jgi:biopolymer transport protein ExbD